MSPVVAPLYIEPGSGIVVVIIIVFIMWILRRMYRRVVHFIEETVEISRVAFIFSFHSLLRVGETGAWQFNRFLVHHKRRLYNSWIDGCAIETTPRKCNVYKTKHMKYIIESTKLYVMFCTCRNFVVHYMFNIKILN